MNPSKELSPEFEKWLADQPANPVLAWRIDPFGTSLRNTKRTVTWLQAIRAGKDIPLDSERSRDQAVIDLKSLGSLVAGSRNPGPVVLTPVGQRVLEAWESWHTLSESSEHEIARCMLLMRLEMIYGPTREQERFRGLYGKWLDLRSVQTAGYWWQDLHHMIMPGYLDIEDRRGFNPWRQLLENHDGIIGESSEWDEWADNEEIQGRPKLRAFLTKARGNHRLGAKTFRQAMELVYLAHHTPWDLESAIEEWSIAT